MAAAASVLVAVLTTAPVNHVSPAYISANFDWHVNSEEYPAWVNSSVQVINFTDPRIETLASAFAPAHLRVGGSEQDEVWYAVDGPCPSDVDSAFCLSMDRWDEINAFAAATGWTVLFGLNAMNGRVNSSSRFDPTNLDAFLRWTAGRRNYTALWGFAFGNELENKVDGACCCTYFLSPLLCASAILHLPRAVAPYAADVLLVRSLIDK
jgi:heparanase 1